MINTTIIQNFNLTQKQNDCFRGQAKSHASAANRAAKAAEEAKKEREQLKASAEEIRAEFQKLEDGAAVVLDLFKTTQGLLDAKTEELDALRVRIYFLSLYIYN